jgi:hypothetical protein
MCGEMIDFFDTMGPPDTTLSLFVNRSFYSRSAEKSSGYTFWQCVYPMITNILRNESNKISGIPEKVYIF